MGRDPRSEISVMMQSWNFSSWVILVRLADDLVPFNNPRKLAGEGFTGSLIGWSAAADAKREPPPHLTKCCGSAPPMRYSELTNTLDTTHSRTVLKSPSLRLATCDLLIINPQHMETLKSVQDTVQSSIETFQATIMAPSADTSFASHVSNQVSSISG